MKVVDYINIFPHNYDVEVLEELPGRAIPRFYFPGANPLGGSDGLLVLVNPPGGNGWLGVFAFGGYGHGLTMVSSTPDESTLCVVSDGAGYLVRADKPSCWLDAPVVPVVEVRPLPDQEMLLMVGFNVIGAVGQAGLLWRTGTLSYDGICLTSVGEKYIEGEGWDPTSAKRPKFKVDLLTGVHEGGPKGYMGKENAPG